MPASHKYLGNPVLSGLGRLFFSIPIGDFHCGLRGFNRDRIRALGLSTTGMEFASEMVVRSALANYRMTEVPTTLAKDGRSRPPHLRTWRDGWRHLRFLLIYSPRWLFLYPGLVLLAFGLAGVLLLFSGDMRLGASTLGINTFIAACMAVLIGVQSITFAAVARRYATLRGLLPPSTRYSAFLRALTPERLLVAGVVSVRGCPARHGMVGVAMGVGQLRAAAQYERRPRLRPVADRPGGRRPVLAGGVPGQPDGDHRSGGRGSSHEIPGSLPAVGAHRPWPTVREAGRRGG